MSEQMEDILFKSMMDWRESDIRRFRKSLKKGTYVIYETFDNESHSFTIKRRCSEHQIDLICHAFFSNISCPEIDGHVIDDIESLQDKVDMMLL